MNAEQMNAMVDAVAFRDWKKKTAIFLTGQNLSLFGSSLVQYAIIWHITLTTQSGLTLTIATLASFIPQIIISLFAGVWADRYNRKRLIILADLLTATTTLVLAVLFLLGYEYLWLLYAASAIRSVGAGLQTPAVSALLPQIVPTDRLIKVNGLNSSIQPVLFILSPILAGTLMTVAELETIFFIDVVTAALAIALMMILHVPPLRRTAGLGQEGYLGDLKVGLRYIRQRPTIMVLFAFFAFVMFLASPVIFLSPLLVARSYGEEVWRLTANEITFFVGHILGGILMSTWGGFSNRFRTIGLGCVLAAILMAAMGTTNLFPLYLTLMFLMGVPIPMINVPTTTLLQEIVEPEIQGRVFGVLSLIQTTVMPAGILIYGPISDSVSIELMLILSGLAMVLPGIWIFFNRAQRQSEQGYSPAD